MTTEIADRAVGVRDPEADDEISADDQDAALQKERWEAINPCPICEAHQVDAPEREGRTALHCWQCGYRPGQTVGMDVVRPAMSADAINAALATLRSQVVGDILEALSKSGQLPTVDIVPPAGVVDATTGAPPPAPAPAPAAPPPPAAAPVTEV